MTTIKLDNVTYTYGDTQVLNSINYTFESNKFYTILGPSGCGKTTILKLIGGFISPASGDIFIDKQVVNNIPANQRKVNTVFQDYALFPHLNVLENIVFGLKIKKVPKKEIDKKLAEVLKLTNLEEFKYRDISDLSGGQRQRVAIARAVINEPDILLLDEPLSALDYNLRVDMQYELKEMQKRLGIIFIFVTHDQEEALGLSDEIIIMDRGNIVQTGSPKDIYDEPLNRYVADFIGESNIVRGTMVKDRVVSIYDRPYDCMDGGIKPGTPVDVMIRPEDIYVGEHNKGQLNVTVDSSLFKGVHYEICCLDEDGYEWVMHSTKNAAVASQVSLNFNKEDIHVMIPGENEENFIERLESFQGDDV